MIGNGWLLFPLFLLHNCSMKSEYIFEMHYIGASSAYIATQNKVPTHVLLLSIDTLSVGF